MLEYFEFSLRKLIEKDSCMKILFLVISLLLSYNSFSGYKHRFKKMMGLSKTKKVKFHRDIVYPTPITFDQNGNFRTS